MSKDDIFKSSLGEECGIAAVWDSNSYKAENPERLDDVARSVFYALFSLSLAFI